MPILRKTCTPGMATKLAVVQDLLINCQNRHAKVVATNHNVSKRFYDYRSKTAAFVAAVDELKLHPQQNPELLERLQSLSRFLTRPHNPAEP